MTDKKPPQKKSKNHYFNNAEVERLLTEYVKGGCIDIEQRDNIMSHASELIRNVIRTHNFHNLYPGKNDVSFNDLYQIAWIQIESTLYKFDWTPGHTRLFNMWCVAPDTMLMTNQGILPIKELCTNSYATSHKVMSAGDNDFGLEIYDNVSRNKTYGLDGFKNINAAVIKQEQDTLKICTQNKYEIECTPEHSLYSMRDGNIEWIKAKHIKEGDLLSVQYNQQVYINNDDISDIFLSKGGDWDHGGKLNKELAYIIGAFIAEGSYSYGKLVIYNVDEDMINTLTNNNLGLNFIHEPKYQRISLCNVRFIEFLQKLGFSDNVRAYTKEIPTRLLQCSKGIMLSMLSGMFDGDGGSSSSNGVVSYTSTSKKLIDQTRMLLLNAGLLSKLFIDEKRSKGLFPGGKVRTKRKSYELFLSTTDSKLLYDNIKFGIARKQLKETNLRNARPMLYGIVDKFRSLYSKYGTGELTYNYLRPTLRAKKYCSLQRASEVLKAWVNYNNDDDYAFIKDRIDEATKSHNNIVWLPVTNIGESKSEVCEISVDSEDHSYIANGFVSHNSQIAKTVIQAHIKKDTRDKKNHSAFRDHNLAKKNVPSYKFGRFVEEAKEIVKYNKEYTKLVGALDELFLNDEKAHDGLIGKLAAKAEVSRGKVTSFLKLVRLRCSDFTDSPLNAKTQKKYFEIAGPRDDEEN